MSIDYIVVSTSKCRYQKWQLELLNWSRKKVGQDGHLVFLLSDDINHQNENVNISFQESDVTVYHLPDWAKQWELENNDWWGGIPNKYESIHWLCQQNLFSEDSNLLFVDPDMLFTKKIDISVDDNQIKAQRWEGTDTLMYPFVINYKTLKRIVDDYKNDCIRDRKETGRWESEMHGLSSAVRNNNIELHLLEDLGRCTIWNHNQSSTISNLIHYPNKIEDIQNNIIFFKQDYTFDPKMTIDIQKGRNQTDKTLLNNIDQSRTDYLYWLKWDDDSFLKDYDGGNGYLSYEQWPGGFNNIRMSFELAVCFAFLTNRTLILPKKGFMYLLEEDHAIQDFFQIDDIGIKYITFEDFCDERGLSYEFYELERLGCLVEKDIVPTVINFTLNPTPHSFLKGREEIKSKEWFSDEEFIHLKRNLLGCFYQTIFTEKDIHLKKLIGKHIRYNNHIFDKAWEFINIIGDKKYYSIHIRRNDFQYKDLFISSEKLLENIKDIIPFGSVLYIATDHIDDTFFEPIKEKYDVYFYNDILDKLTDKNIKSDLIPIIEQLICSRSIKFIGNKLSTLSSYVYRLRGYMNDIEDKLYYINTQQFDTTEQISFRKDNRYIATWAREYPDVWSFDTDKIFLSIASYCDSQLDETIQSAIENISDINRITLVVHLQDTEEEYDKLLKKQFPNTQIIFTHKDDSKGVVWARNRIREKHTDEKYFLQVDSHTRFKKNWDLILINSYNSIDDDKVIITTYPNHFDYPDPELLYLKLDHNTPLRIKRFLLESSDTDNRCVAENLPSLADYEIVKTRWAAAGFFFTKSDWLYDVKIPDKIRFNGEEDHMTFLSFLKGWNHYITPEAVIWHNYDFKNINTDKPYRLYNNNEIDEDASNYVNDFLFNRIHIRNLEELEDYFNIKLKR